MKIWSPKRRDEKLNYMHDNPVKRGLVKQPGDWPWSSWRFYFWNAASILGMDKMLRHPCHPGGRIHAEGSRWDARATRQ